MLMERKNKIQEKTAGRPNENLETPLHIWASLNEANEEFITEDSFQQIMSRLLRYLLQCGAKVNARNENDETPLHMCKTWYAVKLLIDSGANVNDVDSNGRTALLAAALRYRSTSEKTTKDDGFYRDFKDDPVVFWKNAVELGFDPWICDNDGESVLKGLLESFRGFQLSDALVQVACEEKYCKNDNDVVLILNAICKDNNAENDWKDNLVEMLLKRRNIVQLNTALVYCCKNLNNVAKREGGLTETVFWNIAQRLRFYGADPNTHDPSGESCLEIVNTCPQLIKLLAQPIDINKVPIAIPWNKSSQKHREKLAKTARRQECKTVRSYWYHKEEIAIGSFGDVYAAIDTNDGREVAIKRILKTRMTRSEDKREIANLISLADCKHVVRYLSFNEDIEFVYIVLELMEGSLEDGLLKMTSFCESEKIDLCKDVLLGVEYLHKRGVLHRDLKPSNILYKTEPSLCLKIADFGLSRCMTNTSTTVYGTSAGTRCWMAPEVINDCSPTKSSDIFSCGLITHYILSAERHAFEPSKGKPMVKICATELNIINNNMEGWDTSLPPEATQLVKKMLEKDESERLAAVEALAHPMFWSKKKKMDLLSAVGNQPEFENQRAHPVTKVQTDLQRKVSTIVEHLIWDDPRYTNMAVIIAEMTKPRTTLKGKTIPPRKYDKKSVIDLVRLVRNAIQHVSDVARPTPIRKLILEDFVFLEEFPNLVIEVFKVVTTHGWTASRQEIYYAIKN